MIIDRQKREREKVKIEPALLIISQIIIRHVYNNRCAGSNYTTPYTKYTI